MAPRVRFAPSPTGFLHIGGLRTALFNYLHAAKEKGQFIVRIEDTDKARTVPGAANALLNTLERFGIVSDEPVQFQSERKNIYSAQAEKLVKAGSAYPCFCTPERLNLMRQSSKRSMYDRLCRTIPKEVAEEKRRTGEPHTIRLRVPDKETLPYVKVFDSLRGSVSFPTETVDDQILMKSDGMPTYHLASVVDDHEMGITHVIRGEEWLPSTPKHVLLYEICGWEPPKFTHLPLLLNTDGSKLSKRQGDVSVTDFLEKGFLTPAIINFIALLGWSPPGERIEDLLEQDRDEEHKVIFTMPQLQESFSLEHVNKSGAAVDLERLKWINAQHIRMALENEKSSKELVNEIISLLREAGVETSNSTDEEIILYIKTVAQRVQVLPDFVRLCSHFFSDNVDLTTNTAVEMKENIWHENAASMLAVALSELEQLPDEKWNVTNIKKCLRKACKECGVKKKQSKLFMPLRWSVSGLPVGAPLPETLFALGKQRTLQRILSSTI